MVEDAPPSPFVADSETFPLILLLLLFFLIRRSVDPRTVTLDEFRDGCCDATVRAGLLMPKYNVTHDRRPISGVNRGKAEGMEREGAGGRGDSKASRVKEVGNEKSEEREKREDWGREGGREGGEERRRENERRRRAEGSKGEGVAKVEEGGECTRGSGRDNWWELGQRRKGKSGGVVEAAKVFLSLSPSFLLLSLSLSPSLSFRCHTSFSRVSPSFTCLTPLFYLSSLAHFSTLSFLSLFRFFFLFLIAGKVNG